MTPIPFNPQTSPGLTGYDGGGRLINAMAYKLPGLGGAFAFRRAPGLKPAFSTSAFGFRGALEVGSGAYVIQRNACYYVTYDGASYSALLIGTIPGTEPVTIARNNRGDGPDVLVVHEYGIHTLTPTTCLSLVTPNISGAQTISFLDGYFILTFSDARFAASGLNSAAFNALDFATAESLPDGLLRVVRRDDAIVLLGSHSIEYWSNQANPSGMPLGRVTSHRGGIVGPMAVCGHEDGLPSSVPICIVASDGTVSTLSGSSMTPISSLDLQRAIEQDPSRADIRASAFVSEGVVFYVIQLSGGTWVYDTRHQAWHERKSYGLERWKCGGTFSAFGKWFAGDFQTGDIYEIDGSTYAEGDDPLVWTVESGPGKMFPRPFRVAEANFDFAPGTGPLKVMISYSDNGGKTFSNQIERDLGGLGNYAPRARLKPAGMTNVQGRVWRLSVSDPSQVSFIGGAMAIEGMDR